MSKMSPPARFGGTSPRWLPRGADAGRGAVRLCIYVRYYTTSSVLYTGSSPSTQCPNDHIQIRMVRGSIWFHDNTRDGGFRSGLLQIVRPEELIRHGQLVQHVESRCVTHVRQRDELDVLLQTARGQLLVPLLGE
jgi:hypothetical protein